MINLEETINNLIGKLATADHPITVANPDKYFEIEYINYDENRNAVYYRGEETMWFRESMITIPLL